MWGNHTALLVDVGGARFLADAGIGDGFLEPLQLRAGGHVQDGLTYRLERLGPGTWRFHDAPGGSIAFYDFRLRPRDIADFTARSHELSTVPDSTYVAKLIAARRVDGRNFMLALRTLRELGAGSAAPEPIRDIGRFADVLANRFPVPLDDLTPDGGARLSRRAGEQHDLWQARSA